MSPEMLSKLQDSINNDQKPTFDEKYHTKNEENLGIESYCNSCYIFSQMSINEDQESEDEQSVYTKMYYYRKEADKNEQLNYAGDSESLEQGIYNNLQNLLGEKITDDSDDDNYIDVLPYKVQDYNNEVCSQTKEKEVIKITDDSDDDDYIDVLPYFKGEAYNNEVCSQTKEKEAIKRRKNFALRYKYEECKATQGRSSLPELCQNISAPVVRRCKSETSLINENIIFARKRAFCATSIYNCKKGI